MSDNTLAVELEKAVEHSAAPDLLRKAFSFAEKNLDTGLLSHSMNISRMLSDLGFDETTVIAALMHDLGVLGKTQIEEISKEFGSEVGAIVSEFSKIDKIETENFGKIGNELLSTIMLATAKDLRSIFIKITARIDHLENPRNLDREDMVKLASEALYIYAPICQKLGLYGLQSRLEDNGFKVLQPEEFEKLRGLVGKTKAERQAEVEKAIAEFAGVFEKEGKKVEMQGRAKSLYSIYKKMQANSISFGEILDGIGIRAICDSVRECYELLGIIHSRYKTVPNHFDDYIANPKKNGYKSIHTVVIWDRIPLEVQIRTREMHYENETGVASHWQYKKYASDRFFDKRLALAKQLVEWHRNARNSGVLSHSLKMGFGQNRIFVFTPKNKVVVLSESSTPVDFAFALHTDLGNRCKKAKVNGKMVPLSHKLENADVVEISAGKEMQAKRQWLSFAKTGKAQTKIRQVIGLKPLKKKSLLGLGSETLTSDGNTRIAKCCNPVPGDGIVGVRTTKRKISVHREGCGNVSETPKDKLIKIRWGLAEKGYVVGLNVKASNRPGVLPAILKVFNEEGCSITSTSAKTGNSMLNCSFCIRIRNLGQFEKIADKIRAIPGVFEAGRE